MPVPNMVGRFNPTLCLQNGKLMVAGTIQCDDQDDVGKRVRIDATITQGNNDPVNCHDDFTMGPVNQQTPWEMDVSPGRLGPGSADAEGTATIRDTNESISWGPQSVTLENC